MYNSRKLTDKAGGVLCAKPRRKSRYNDLMQLRYGNIGMLKFIAALVLRLFNAPIKVCLDRVNCYFSEIEFHFAD